MGIEDFNLESREDADRIMFVGGSDLPAEAASILSLLQYRGYACSHVASVAEAERSPLVEMMDLAIIRWPEEDLDIIEVVAKVASVPILAHAALIILHHSISGTADGEAFQTDLESANLLPWPTNKADLLVRVATQLRMRKVRDEHAALEEKTSSQNAHLRDLTNRFRQELKEAQQIQQAILPTQLPALPAHVLTATYVPLEVVGGDLFDIWEIDHDRIGFFIGDVTGHGLPAALIGAMTKMSLSYASKTSPDIMLSEMSAGIYDHMPEGRFVTVAAAFYNHKTNRLQVARGGHPPSFLWRKSSGEVELLSPKGFALGFMKEAHYELFETTLEPGDKFMMITDGLPETSNLAGSMIGITGVQQMFRNLASDYGIESCLEKILLEQEEFAEGRLLKDDDTLLGLERRKR